MPELDTIRGVAVLLVLFFHGFGFRYGLHGLSGFPRLFVAVTLPGWIGVNLFFVLSGFPTSQGCLEYRCSMGSCGHWRWKNISTCYGLGLFARFRDAGLPLSPSPFAPLLRSKGLADIATVLRSASATRSRDAIWVG
jgi:hypothetical protein